MKTEKIVALPLGNASISRAIRRGWLLFKQTRRLSVSFAMIFALIGVFILSAFELASVVPMMLPLAGGFMLLGPLALAGFFSIADRVEANQIPQFSDVVNGFFQTSRETTALGLVCTLLFLIWMTDAATLYGFMVGRTPMSLMTPIPDAVWSFVGWSSLMGAVLAFVIFAVSAFSVPLLYYRRTGLVAAVVLSVKTVFSNFSTCIQWALVLSGVIIGSILVFPLFLLTFPVLAFASHALYRECFPE